MLYHDVVFIAWVLCAAQIELPRYGSEVECRERLLLAIHGSADRFDMA